MKRVCSALLILAAYALYSQSVDIRHYEFEDYLRHPRMEEEDRLRGRVFGFANGLEIITNTDDAEIRFFEEKAGRTPWEQDNLPAGLYRVSLERTGFEPVEFQVTVFSDRRTVVLAEMVQAYGTLILTGLPDGASVFIDNKSVSGREISVPAGPHTLRVSAFGRETRQEQIRIESGSQTEWTYNGQPLPFGLEQLKVRPGSLPPGDLRGFRIEWSAVSGGTAEISIFSPDGQKAASIPVKINAQRGQVTWIPVKNEQYTDGTYTVRMNASGADGTESSAESMLNLDGRFKRRARLMSAPLPGMLYAPGSAMLPAGVWQMSTGIGLADSGIPAFAGLRVSPAQRLELTFRFGLRAEDPFDTTSPGFSLSGSWRLTPAGFPLTANAALLFSHSGYASGFDRIPMSGSGTSLPGLQLSVPFEKSLKKWNFVLTPGVHLAFLGTEPDAWRFSGPGRLAVSAGTGAYYESGAFAAGVSAAVRSAALNSSADFLTTTVWYGLEGRVVLPGRASSLAAYAGLRTLNGPPSVSAGVEFSLLR